MRNFVQTSFRTAFLFFAIFGASICSTNAQAAPDKVTNRNLPAITGSWKQNAPDPVDVANGRIGKLSIGSGAFAFTGDSNVTYKVDQGLNFGDGLLFKVLSISNKNDPHGCGPSEKTHFLFVKRLETLQLAGDFETLQVWFYGGNKPVFDKLKDDIAVCAIVPYGRTVNKIKAR